MKNLFLLFFFIGGYLICNGQNVGIGTNNPATSAILELKDTTRGFLPPRMTLSQRNAIPSPVAGLIIWCSDCDELQVFNGVIWKNMNGNIASGITPPSITICDKVWMIKNLDVDRYKNGDIIPQVTDATTWKNLTTGAWCWYNNDSISYASTYGKLYNWYAVNDLRGLAPFGWHIPSKAEWAKLADTCLGDINLAGGKLKEAGTIHWASPNLGATNSTGFTALPGGSRLDVSFSGITAKGNWWSATEFSATDVWFRSLSSSSSSNGGNGSTKKFVGFSVRCVKD